MKSTLILTVAACLMGAGGCSKRHQTPQQETPEANKHSPEDIATAAAPLTGVTNYFDNGLSEWAADTNHSFGPYAASNTFVIQHPNKFFYIRWRNATNGTLEPILKKDRSFRTAEEAVYELKHPFGLFLQKVICDALEDELKPVFKRMDNLVPAWASKETNGYN